MLLLRFFAWVADRGEKTLLRIQMTDAVTVLRSPVLGLSNLMMSF